MFILPALIGFFGFILIPFIVSFILSFTEWNFISGLSGIKFVGLSNFKELFTDVWFTDSLKNNILFTVTVVPISLIAGLIIAVLIQKYTYFGTWIKVMIFMPYISSVVAIAVVWMVLLQPAYGPFNQFLVSIGITSPPQWLADMKWSLPTLIFITIWQGIGYYVIIFIGGLNSISESIYESAEIDGANFWKKLWSISIPLVSPTTFFLAITGIIHSFKVFDLVSVLTEGGPGTSTTVLAYYIYKAAFKYNRMGYASAIAWIVFIIIFIITIVQWKGQDKLVTYE
ncbi:MAG: carbohydrate ABC transporter permease [Clostridium sp.]|uniref:carbohydrate ABC transporter permease n=1 Tax=Clostridium sp. TaxID=1506 RepID=UPI003D6D4810